MSYGYNKKIHDSTDLDTVLHRKQLKTRTQNTNINFRFKMLAQHCSN